MLLIIFILMNAWILPAFSSPDWTPGPKQLHLKVGIDYYFTDENFNREGLRQNVAHLGQSAGLSEFSLWLEPEYSFAPYWSILLRTTFISSQVNAKTGGTLLSSTGLADIVTSLKWEFSPGNPSLAAETQFVIPTYSNQATSSDLILGDGNFDFHNIFHLAYEADRFLFVFSPGIVWRASRFSHAVTVSAGASATFAALSVGLYFDWFYSIEELLNFNTSFNQANAPGSGGSYSRLSESPNRLSSGLSLGGQISPGYFMEGYIERSLFGSRSALYTQGGLTFTINFDLLVPEKKRSKLKELPLDYEPGQDGL